MLTGLAPEQLGQNKGEIPGVGGAGNFATRMHRQLGAAEIQRTHSERSCDGRANRRSTWHVTAAHELLSRDASAFGGQVEQSSRASVGGVALVLVVLEDGSRV